MRIEKMLLCAVVVLGGLAVGAGRPPQPDGVAPLWQPTTPAARLQDYTGSSVCLQCHGGAPSSQPSSEMGLSVARPAEARVLKDHPELSFARGPFTYTLGYREGRPVFSVSDGKGTVTEPIYLVVGSGTVFQAYLIHHGDRTYRVPVDYFAAQGKLGLDTEADAAMPSSLEAALGKPLSDADVRGCMRCHSPASVVGDRIDTSMTPGIGCEVCHGPGARHAAGVEAGEAPEKTIFNPGRVTPQQKSALCNQCHTSASAMKEQKPTGVRGVVSPAYRLESSRCFNAGDARSTCTFCHEPHAPMVRDTAAYDGKCLACHASTKGSAATAGHPGKGCPVGQRDCAGCHMPRYSIPNNPILFTDHRIRVAAPGASFPE